MTRNRRKCFCRWAARQFVKHAGCLGAAGTPARQPACGQPLAADLINDVKLKTIPPGADAEHVWRTEDAIRTYRLPYDPGYPVVCSDESGRRLFGEVRPPRRGRARRDSPGDPWFTRGVDETVRRYA